MYQVTMFRTTTKLINSVSCGKVALAFVNYNSEYLLSKRTERDPGNAIYNEVLQKVWIVQQQKKLKQIFNMMLAIILKKEIT